MSRAVKAAAVIAGSVWAVVKVTQWTMAQALRLAVLGLALWFVSLAVRELMR